MKTRPFTAAAAVAMVLIMLGPAAPASSQELSKAALSGDSDAMWSEGRDLARRGERLVAKGEQRMASGRRDVRDGEDRIRAGNQGVASRRLDYEQAVDSYRSTNTSKSAASEARRLRDIGKRWEKALEDIRAGNELVDRGNKKIDEGHAEILEGQRLVELGSLLMRNSERQRRGLDLLPAEIDTDSPPRR